jgi:hypothetical protein
MECWSSDFHRGVIALSRHDPGSAVGHFSRALRECPVDRNRELARLLYYLGMALRRLGFPNSAVRTWITSQRARRHRQTRELIQRFANGYGMAKQRSGDLDDWQAFYAMQVKRYLRCFGKHAFSNAEERCVVADIIRDTWLMLRAGGALEGKSTAEKSLLFQAANIDFPLFHQIEEPVLRVDFRSGERLCGGSPCFCGSGLPFQACCGRTPGEDELNVGFF